jgi:hypothetical protein
MYVFVCILLGNTNCFNIKKAQHVEAQSSIFPFFAGTDFRVPVTQFKFSKCDACPSSASDTIYFETLQ